MTCLSARFVNKGGSWKKCILNKRPSCISFTMWMIVKRRHGVRCIKIRWLQSTGADLTWKCSLFKHSWAFVRPIHNWKRGEIFLPIFNLIYQISLDCPTYIWPCINIYFPVLLMILYGIALYLRQYPISIYYLTISGEKKTVPSSSTFLLKCYFV